MIDSKICGITRPQDARLAAELGAAAIGLVFYAGSKRAVSAEQAAQIVQVLPPFVSAVGLFVNESAQGVREILERVPLNLLQFHGDEDAAFCRSFRRPYLKAVRVSCREDIEAARQHFPDARALLFDACVEGAYGGTGHRFDWSLLPADLDGRWILSGGLSPENVLQAVRETGARNLDVSSGVEQAPGIKCPQKMAAFLQAARQAEALR